MSAPHRLRAHAPVAAPEGSRAMALNGLHMRDATPADLPAIIALLAADAQSPGQESCADPPDPAYLAAFHAIDADPNQRLIAAELDGKLIGTLQLSFLPGLLFRGGWRGQVEAVRITAPLRGRGLGAALIDWAIEACRARGCCLVQLGSHVARADAHRFYERLGFARSHAGFRLQLDRETP
jgi:GNAT superfamily N-acetyltransferase